MTITDDLNRAYWLALLLTANQRAAEAAVISALDEGGRRSLLHNTVSAALASSTAATPDAICVEPELHAVLRLPAIQRQVYVLRMLEAMSADECSDWLSLSKEEVDCRAVLAAIRCASSFGNEKGGEG